MRRPLEAAETSRRVAPSPTSVAAGVISAWLAFVACACSDPPGVTKKSVNVCDSILPPTSIACHTRGSLTFTGDGMRKLTRLTHRWLFTYMFDRVGGVTRAISTPPSRHLPCSSTQPYRLTHFSSSAPRSDQPWRRRVRPRHQDAQPTHSVVASAMPSVP